MNDLKMTNMNNEFKFEPARTYADADNARKAITAILCEGDRFMIVGVPGTLRFAPIVTAAAQPAHYANKSFTVVGIRSGR